MLVSLCYVALGRLLQLALLCVRSNDFKELEVIVPRHELDVLRRRIGRPAMTWRDPSFAKMISAGTAAVLERIEGCGTGVGVVVRAQLARCS